MLAFPTFVQQSVSIKTRQIPSGTGYTFLLRSANVTYPLENYSSSNGIRNSVAIAQGILSHSPIDATTFTGSCAAASARCTWELFTTQAVCSSVTNITDQLTVHPKVDVPPLTPLQSLGPKINKSTTLHSYTLYPSSSHPDIGESAHEPVFAETHISFYNPCLEEPEQKRRNKSESINYSTTKSEYWTAIAIKYWPCLQTMNVTYDGLWRSRIMNQTERPEWKYEGMYEGIFLDSYCTKDASNASYCISISALQSTGGAIYNAYSMSVQRNGTLEPDSPDWARLANIKINNAGYEYFSSSNTSQWATRLISDVRGTEDAREWWHCKSGIEAPMAKLTARSENIAASLSLALRASDDRVRVDGTALVLVTVIEVNFYWLMMPIGVYLIMTVFFFATVIRGRESPL
jgi:hypothetical protein